MRTLYTLLPAALFLAPLAFVPGCEDSEDDTPTSTSTQTSTGTPSSTATGTDTNSTSTSTSTSTGTDSSTGTNPGKVCANPNDPAAPIVEVSADISSAADANWTCDKIYKLTQHVYVRGVTLNIEAGTTIYGAEASSLIIEKDAKINAVGTPEKPIVMTSPGVGGIHARGDWGGLVLIGQAKNNLPNGVGNIEGFPTPTTYGGQDPAHNCGTLQYVRVEWAGYLLSEGNEINAITFYSCGTQTTVDHVQTHMGADDGFEFFGGGFNAHHLVVTGTDDDGFDCDQGFTGKLQYLVVHQDVVTGDSAFEWSNQGKDFNALPSTYPQVANATLVGSVAPKSKGWILKEGGMAEVYNSVFTNFGHEAVFLVNKQTQASLEANTIFAKGTFFFGNGTPEFKTGVDSGATTDENSETITGAQVFAKFQTPEWANQFGVDPMLTSIAWGAPNFLPKAGSPLATGGVALPAGFEPTTYVGAVDPASTSPWTAASWINYNPN